MKLLILEEVAIPTLNIKMVENRWITNPADENELLGQTVIILKDNTEVFVDEDFEEVSSLLASI